MSFTHKFYEMTRLQRVEYLNKKDLLTPDQAKLLQNSTAGYIHDINDYTNTNDTNAGNANVNYIKDMYIYIYI